MKMTDYKKSNASQESSDDWEFTNVRLKKSRGEDDPSRSKAKEARTSAKKNEKLVLDEAAVPKAKTRTAMAREMQEMEEKDEDDIYSLASIPKRAIAFLIDSIFTAAIIYIAKFAAPLWPMLIGFFFKNPKLQFITSGSTAVNNVFFIISTLTALFFLVVIPVSFFNCSLGKKLLGLRVRGEGRYTLSIRQAFNRELILKPFGILIIAGFVTPFFSKKKLSIHDMLSHTFVVKD
jgi:uncharacterized RDD family membrane protein YckC